MLVCMSPVCNTGHGQDTGLWTMTLQWDQTGHVPDLLGIAEHCLFSHVPTLCEASPDIMLQDDAV